MFDNLEEFLKAHQYTTTALGAIGTFSAVVVSLTVALLSQRANRTRVNASAMIGVIMHPTLKGEDKPTYLTAIVRNAGILPVTIPLSFFFWKMPFRRGVWLASPLDYWQTDKWVPQKRYPVEIKARASETFYLSEISTFRSMFCDIFKGANFFDRCRFRFLTARVVTVTAQRHSEFLNNC